MNDSEPDAPNPRGDGVPQMLPDRDELARAEVAAYWMATGDRGPLDSGLMRVEVCTRALRLADVTHEAAPGHRLRLRLRHATQKVFITEERDTGSVFVWDTLAPTGGVARRWSAGAGRGPEMTTERSTGDEWADVAEEVLCAAMVAMLGGLLEEERERFIELVGKLPWLLHSLHCRDAFYGHADRDADRLACAALLQGVRPVEVALVALVAGLAQWCAEPALRHAVAAVADLARSTWTDKGVS
jgi:hypothetical protein